MTNHPIQPLFVSHTFLLSVPSLRPHPSTEPYPSRLLPDKKEVEAAKRHVNETSRLTRQMSMNSQLADRVNMRVSAGPSARKLSLVAPAAAPEVAGMAGREQSMSPVLGNPGGGGGGGMMIVPQKSGTKVSLMPRYASPAGSGINVPSEFEPRRGRIVSSSFFLILFLYSLYRAK